METRIVTFRMFSAEFAQISTHAARAGLTISGAVRALVFSSLGDKRPDDILKRLTCIERMLERPAVPAAVLGIEHMVLIKQALASLIEQHFLPVAYGNVAANWLCTNASSAEIHRWRWGGVLASIGQ